MKPPIFASFACLDQQHQGQLFDRSVFENPLSDTPIIATIKVPPTYNFNHRTDTARCDRCSVLTPGVVYRRYRGIDTPSEVQMLKICFDCHSLLDQYRAEW